MKRKNPHSRERVVQDKRSRPEIQPQNDPARRWLKPQTEPTEAKTGLLLKPVPNMKDWAGADAGKYTYSEMIAKLDKQRRRWR